MIKVESVEISKNPVATNEAFLIKVTAREVLATWNDVKLKTWGEIKNKTWEQIKRKIF